MKLQNLQMILQGNTKKYINYIQGFLIGLILFGTLYNANGQCGASVVQYKIQKP